MRSLPSENVVGWRSNLNSLPLSGVFMEEPANIMEETCVTLSFSITHVLFFLLVEIKSIPWFYAFFPPFLSALFLQLQFDVGLRPAASRAGFFGQCLGQFCV